MTRIFLILLGISIFIQGPSQKMPLGVYTGNGGLWYLRPDSSFIFLKEENGLIKSAGVGKWHYTGKNDIAVFIFSDSLNSLVLNNYKAIYQTETRMPLDSVYISGRAIGMDGKPCSFISVFIEGKKYGSTADKDGIFHFRYPAGGGTNSLTFIKRIDPGYLPLTFQLSPNNNYHNLNITIPLLDSLSFLPVENSRVELKLTPKNISMLTLGYLPNGIARFKTLISSAKNRQPLLIHYLQAILRMID